MEYYSAIKNNEFMKFLGKWMEVENIILSEIAHKRTHKVCPHCYVDISPKVQNTQDSIHRPYEAQEGRPKCGCFIAS